MGWANTWDDILSGGNQRWKVTCGESHQLALAHIERHVPMAASSDDSSGGSSAPPSIFCPLAGDDPMVYLLWKRGYSVTSIDLVPAAVEAMRSNFQTGEWTKRMSDNTEIWAHDSGRVTLYVGDALQSRPELNNKFDAIYDKDSFGALGKEMRSPYCNRLADYLKKEGIVYAEVKLKENHEEVKHVGPPFSLKEEDLIQDSSFGRSFAYVESLGSVYDVTMPGMQQTGHVMRRK